MSKLIQVTTFPPGVELTLTGMILPPGLPIEEWYDSVELIANAQRLKALEIIALDWAMADLLNYGEREYGQKYAQAVLVTGLSEHTLANKCWAANKIPQPERVEGLTIEHHAQVAALPAPERDALLDMAKRDHATVLDLRTKVRHKKIRESGKDPLVEDAIAALTAAVDALTKLPGSQRAGLVIDKLIVPLANADRTFPAAVVSGVSDIE